MHALLDLGKRLVAQPESRLRQLSLDEKLYDAIRLAQRTNSREGLRRQIHYVGKLMRGADAEAIRARLDAWESGSRAEARAMHKIEALRDLLIRDDEALTEFLALHPDADAQYLRTLIRACRKEAARNEAADPESTPLRKHYRSLFQALKTLDSTQEPKN